MNFAEFIQVSDNYEIILNDCAQIILDKEIDPKSLNELADIYLEFNPLALAGGIGGSMLAGPAGAVGGGIAGQKTGQAVGGWLKGGQANKISPAFQQAKDATNKLIAALTGASQKVPEAKTLLQNAQAMNQSLQQVEPKIAGVDQTLAQMHDTETKQAGGIAQKLQGVEGKGILGKMARRAGDFLGKSDMLSRKGGVRGAIAGVGDKLSAWGKRHPVLSKGLQAGGAVAAGSMLGGMAGMAGAGADPGVGGGGADVGGGGGADVGGADSAAGLRPEDYPHTELGGTPVLDPEQGFQPAQTPEDIRQAARHSTRTIDGSVAPRSGGVIGNPEDIGMGPEAQATAAQHTQDFQSQHTALRQQAIEGGMSRQMAARLSPTQLAHHLGVAPPQAATSFRTR